ncbi:carboxypeptidase [Pedobacter yulinensis]|uniref:Carboxypeptidase n=1 Tax=Pedobacter yulinensis TaxID=2126353 RepID=A0A2T3HLM1_9SPHI|nr:M14 family zinc carboxypeptidase [Pedobacter yulinensis]PST83342.1 carboxypeptidase [Pedobacter yulinensis]
MEHLLAQYSTFREPALTDRFFKHAALQPLLDRLPPAFSVEEIGQSAEGRSLRLVSWGNGPVKIFLWSQMHGDEATGTMAMFDLFRFLDHPAFKEEWKQIQEHCTLLLLPMVNPDGAERFTRRSAQGIDINRDYLQTVTAEARVLKATRERHTPDYGFNLHDQSTLWSVAATGKPASLSYLAPADTPGLTFGPARTRAAAVIAQMYSRISPLVPDQIGLFDDSHEPRAFGDNFQQAGMATILIEAGGLQRDPEKQRLREYYFLSILAGLQAIAGGVSPGNALDRYFEIPKNSETLMHVMLRRVQVNGVVADIGLNYQEIPEHNAATTAQFYQVKDLGDLHSYQAYEEITGEALRIAVPVHVESEADFDLHDGERIILSFRKGRRNKNFILS